MCTQPAPCTGAHRKENNMDLTLILPISLAVLGAVILILKVVAPKTKTLKDDKALEILETIEDAASGLDKSDEEK